MKKLINITKDIFRIYVKQYKVKIEKDMDMNEIGYIFEYEDGTAIWLPEKEFKQVCQQANI